MLNHVIAFTEGLDVDFVRGTGNALEPEILESLARYRHRVFIEKLGWQLPCMPGEERDQFDGPHTIYIAARNEAGAVIGSARLLPTDQPYLLAEVFPQLMGGFPLPRTPRVWELSRFAAVDLAKNRRSTSSQFNYSISIPLLEEVLAVARAHGAERLITVSPLGVERLLRRAGFIAHRAAPPVIIDGSPLFACWIELKRLVDNVAPLHAPRAVDPRPSVQSIGGAYMTKLAHER